MSVFSFTNPLTGQIIEVEGPPGLTEVQAAQIFKQQLDAGSLIGLKSGDVVNSATQLAGGLKTAASQVLQTVSGIAGSSQGALTGVLDKARLSASALPTAGVMSQVQSVAGQTLRTITSSVQSIVPSDGINVSDLTKQATGLMPIQGLDQVNVRAAMSQASKLVGQAADVVSNELGAGKFGFDAQQLERAGVLKPGTFTTYITNGGANLSSVLNSPAVWTGVNGITNVDSLLKNIPAQDRIQQSLMSQGLGTVKNLGIPINKLTPQSLAGVALNTAKNITDTMSWAKGLPLPSSIKNALNTIGGAAAFAVGFAKEKTNNAVRQEDSALPAADTVNRTTIDAASARVTGSDKIPTVNYQSTDQSVAQTKATATVYAQLKSLGSEFTKTANNTVKTIKSTAQSTDAQQNLIHVAESIVQLDQDLSDFYSFKGQIEGILREIKRIERVYGTKVFFESSAELTSTQLDGYITVTERAIAEKKQVLETLSQSNL